MDWSRFNYEDKSVPQLYRMAFDMYHPAADAKTVVNVNEFASTVASEVYNTERSLFQRAYMDAVLMTLTHKMIPNEEKITKKVGEKWCAFIDMAEDEIAQESVENAPKDSEAN